MEHDSQRAAERGSNNLKSVKGFCQNGSSQGLNLALTVLYVPNSLDSGRGVLSLRGVNPHPSSPKVKFASLKVKGGLARLAKEGSNPKRGF